MKKLSFFHTPCFPFCILVSTLSFSFSMDQGSFSYSLFHHFLIVFAIASGDNCKKTQSSKNSSASRGSL